MVVIFEVGENYELGVWYELNDSRTGYGWVE